MVDKFSLEAWRRYPENRICPELMITPLASLQKMIEVFSDGFERCFSIIDAFNTASIEEARKIGENFGLCLTADGNNADSLIDIRVLIAGQNLQRIWKTAPVLLHVDNMSDCNDTDEILRSAARWHVTAANIPGIYPALMALRRLTFPALLSNGGVIPLRFWWQNVGNAPLYFKSRPRVWLRGNGFDEEMALCDEKPMREIGDYTHHEIAQLPQMSEGEYELLCGYYAVCTTSDSYENETALPLAINAPREEDGRYIVGTIKLDEKPRPEYWQAWDDYYPDGYYPLEDPKLPV